VGRVPGGFADHARRPVALRHARRAHGRLAYGRRPRSRRAQDEALRQAVESGGCWLWLDDGAEPRSLAVRRPAVNGVSRIGPVYTPPRSRGHGFGSAATATAAATRGVLAEGAVACLFTDLGNSTSNRIYQALGYLPVLDRTLVSYD
jgi:predicted GNAT family acetyltransferase